MITRNINQVIDLFDGEHTPVKFLCIGTVLNNQSQSVGLRLHYTQLGCFPSRWHESRHDLEHVTDWERLGAAIGRNSTLNYLMVDRHHNDHEDWDNNLSSDVFQCIQALYRGIQLNTSIQELVINMDLFPCDGSLPQLNLHDAQFKEVIQRFKLLGGFQAINDNQSIMMKSFLESVSLKSCIIDRNDSDTAFRRIILACSKVKRLDVRCVALSQYASVATLMRDSRSILSELVIHGRIDRERLSAIAAGLVNNTTLKKLSFPEDALSWGDMSPIAKALCETSSIEQIIASNHTLESITFGSVTPIIQECLTLNKKTNRELVIRTKIARYYFQDEFDISTLASMDAKCLPRVLAMIGGGETNQNAVSFEAEDATYQQFAIFRLLKCIPDICNVSSRIVGKAEGLVANDSSKRQKVNK